MQIPLDIKAVINEATDLDAVRQTPLSVSIYMDETSPGDVQALLRQAFASTSPYAKVSIGYFSHFSMDVVAESDVAVIVAGLNEHVGEYAADIRKAGTPAMVVSTLPHLVAEIACYRGNPLPEEDLIGSFSSLAQNNDIPREGDEAEPYVLTATLKEALLKRMGEWVVETCKEKRLACALAFPFVRRPLSCEAVDATSLQNAGIGLVAFIPGTDLPIMTLNQTKMLLQIAAAYGQPLSLDRAKELAVIVGGAFFFRSIARQISAFVPLLGWAAKAFIAYSGTWAIGHAAIEYFEEGGSVKGLLGIVGSAEHACRKVPFALSARKSIAGGLVCEKLVPAVTSLAASVAQVLRGTDMIQGKAVSPFHPSRINNFKG